MIERNTMISSMSKQWGKPYQFGSKWVLTDPDPKGSVDCSGFSRWAYFQINIQIPEGSTQQHAESILLTPSILILPGDLVFLRTPEDQNVEHHVGLVYDKYFIIEARGIKINGQEIGSVQLRSRTEWEARPDFIGYFRPKSVTAIEGV